MPVNYSIAMRPNPQDPEQPKKAYAQAQMRDELTLKGLSKRISSQTTVSRADVSAVLISAVENMVEALKAGDQVAIGATSRPNLIYGIGASFSWKGFDLNIHFQGAGKTTFPINGKCVYAFSEEDWGQIFKGMLDDRWVDAETAAKLGIAANEDPNASYPRLTYGANKNNQQQSTFWMRDGRYIRLKNLDIGYTLPKAFVNRMHFNNIRVYVTGSNLLTWSKFDTWDPETARAKGEAYPLTKSVTMGITVNL